MTSTLTPDEFDKKVYEQKSRIESAGDELYFYKTISDSYKNKQYMSYDEYEPYKFIDMVAFAKVAGHDFAINMINHVNQTSTFQNKYLSTNIPLFNYIISDECKDINGLWHISDILTDVNSKLLFSKITDWKYLVSNVWQCKTERTMYEIENRLIELAKSHPNRLSLDMTAPYLKLMVRLQVEMHKLNTLDTELKNSIQEPLVHVNDVVISETNVQYVEEKNTDQNVEQKFSQLKEQINKQFVTVMEYFETIKANVNKLNKKMGISEKIQYD